MIPDNVLQCPEHRLLEPKSRWQLPPQVLVYYSLLLSQTNLGQAVDRFGRPSVSCMDLARVSKVVETDSSIFPLHRLLLSFSPAARCRRLLQAPVMPGCRRCFAASFGVDRGWTKFRPSKMYRSVSELGYERKDEPPCDLPARKQYLSLFIYTLYTICAYIANSSFLKDDRKHPYVHTC